jgi:hypothetical protein
MAERFKIDDHVSWNSEAGRVSVKWTPFGGPCQALIKLEPTPL